MDDTHTTSLPAIPDSGYTVSVPLRVDVRSKSLTMHLVSEETLDLLVSRDAPLFLAFFGITFGAALALGITLTTVDLSSSYIIAAYWGSFVVTFVLSVVFFIKGFSDWRRSKRELKAIKEQGASVKAVILDQVASAKRV